MKYDCPVYYNEGGTDCPYCNDLGQCGLPHPEKECDDFYFYTAEDEEEEEEDD